MGVEITYTVAGRKVSRDQFFDGIEGQLRKAAVDEVTANVQRVRCATHGKTATVSEVRETGEGFSFSVSGCCDEVVSRARDALG